MVINDWSLVELGSVVDLINGRGFKSKEWSEEGIPIIRISNLNGDPEFNRFNGDYDEKHYIRKGDLLFSWSGNRGTSFGPHVWKGPEGLLNQHIFKFIIKDNEDVEKNFLYYSLLRLTFIIENSAHGGSGLVHIKKSDLVNFKLPLPQIVEQKKIASIISSVDETIEKTEQIIEQTTKVKKGLMQQLLTRGIGHTNFKAISSEEIPQEWGSLTLGEVADVIDPQPDHRAPKEDVNGFPYVGVGDINIDGTLDFTKARKVSEKAVIKQEESFTIEEGDLAFGKVGTIGNPRFLPINTRYALSATMVLIKPRNITSEYLYFALQSPIINKQIKQLTTGSTRPTVGILRLRKFIIPIPSLKEQNRISTVLMQMEDKIKNERKKLTQLNLIKKGLMQQLLTGKVRVPIDAEEVIST